MSGAYSIDVEVGNSPDNPDAYRFYCASLTDRWEKDQNETNFPALIAELAGIESVKSVLPPRPDGNNISQIENYIGTLSCQIKILRLKVFQDFLGIPKSVTEAYEYINEKPFGKEQFASELQKHSRFTKHGGGKRFVRLTNEGKTGSLAMYLTEQNPMLIGSFNLAPNSTKCDLVPRVNNGFVLKNGKRQWVFQATNRKEFGDWLVNLAKILGPERVPKPPSSENEEKEALKDVSGKDLANLQMEEIEMKKQFESLQYQLEGMEHEIKALKFQNQQLNLGKEELRKEIEQEFNREREDIVKDYEIQNNNLQDIIDELNGQLKAKASVPQLPPKTLDFGKFFKRDGGGNEKEEKIEDLIQIDVEKEMLRQLGDEEKLKIKHDHKHLHKHGQKHVHEHRHTHIDKDMKEQGLIPDHIEFTDKHDLSHNITHTNTQMILEGKDILGL